MNKNNSQTTKKSTPKQSLYRFISDEWCEPFVKSGSIHLGSLKHYAEIESDVRADISESVASSRNEFGNSTNKAVVNGAPYILCCSKVVSNDDVRLLKNKFNPNGFLYLEIFNPMQFLEEFTKSLMINLPSFLRVNTEEIYWVDVEYTKGCLNVQNFDAFSNIEVFQKPKEQLSPMLRIKKNGLLLSRRQANTVLPNDSDWEPYWPSNLSPTNYEEEQECRLVANGFSGYSVEIDGAYVDPYEIEDTLKSKYSLQVHPTHLLPKFIDLSCGNLADCVRIRDIRDLN